jgi:antitoxin component YwqK of YwqJK toxin-antitoxin module
MQQYIEKHINGTKKCEGQATFISERMVKHGTWREWSETGVLVSESNYFEGYATGVWKEWYESGQLAKEKNYFEGTKHDTPNYLKGSKHGTWKKWYESGQLAKEENYFEGHATGVWKEWYENGQLQSEKSYNDNCLNGPWKKWSETGSLVSESFFVRGRCDGVLKEWYESGEIYSEETFLNGKNHGVSSYWYENGQLMSESWYTFGKENGVRKEWYEDGQMSSETTYVCGVVDGIVTTWYRNGQMKCAGELYEGFLDEYSTNDPNDPDYDPDCEPILIKTGRHLSWYSNGQLQSDIVFEEGIPVEGTRWNQDGTVAETYSPSNPPSEPVVVQRETKYTCLILHDEIPSGDKYMLCSFSEEHVHDYNALQSFLRAARQTRATCQYCTNPMKEEIYQQP